MARLIGCYCQNCAIFQVAESTYILFRILLKHEYTTAAVDKDFVGKDVAGKAVVGKNQLSTHNPIIDVIDIATGKGIINEGFWTNIYLYCSL